MVGPIQRQQQGTFIHTMPCCRFGMTMIVMVKIIIMVMVKMTMTSSLNDTDNDDDAGDDDIHD